MKIQKVIFSSSARFSVFWDLQARAWENMGIHPVCLLFGGGEIDRSRGTVIDVPWIEGIPEILQIVWSKFHWTQREPDTTWLIGDIDLLPLAPRWYTSNIEHVPDGDYVHLDADGICQLSHNRSWVGLSSPPSPPLVDQGCGSNLPGHYHAAKGSTFLRALDIGVPFEEDLRSIMENHKNVRGFREEDPEHHEWWCCEELRSTRAIRPKINSGAVKFHGFHLRHGIGRRDGDRLDKSMYDAEACAYAMDDGRLESGAYVDLHCIRPFAEFFSEEECAKRLSASVDVMKKVGLY